MSCVKPFSVKLNDTFADVDCGRCMQCRIKKQSALKFLAERELLDVYKSGRGASFVTLTYDDDNVPFVHLPTGNYYRGLLNLVSSRNETYFTLCQKDVADFNKRVRRNMDYHKCKIPYKVIYCGEFGGKTDRPHYHLLFLGLSDVLARQFTRKCWQFGLCDVGPLSAGGIDYVTKYILKSETYDKDIAALFHHCNVELPFLYHSVGLGKDWLIKNADKLAESGYTFLCNGKRQLLPKHIIDFVKNFTGLDPEPYINDYFNQNSVKAWKLSNSNMTFNGYDAEKAFIRERFLIHSARSRGLNVDPEFLAEKKWCRPVHTYDRIVDKNPSVFEPYKSIWYNELRQLGWNHKKIFEFFQKIS